jgi:hypothetical protein
LILNVYREIIVNYFKLLANLMDTSQNVIVDLETLISLIAAICEIPLTNVHIQIRGDEEPTCCLPSKLSPIKTISGIRVVNNDGITNDFHVLFNTEFNSLKGEYKISLTSVHVDLKF